MTKTVWTFGLIAGAVLSAMMLVTLPFIDRIGFDRGEVIGYATMVAAFLLVFFGVRSYRDNVAGGAISFGRALAVGLLITVIASACYVVTWQLIYYKLAPDFGEKYAAHMVARERASGASQEVIDSRIARIERFQELYRNPFVNIAITFVEPLPVGVIIALVSAGVLRRKRQFNAVAASST